MNQNSCQAMLRTMLYNEGKKGRALVKQPRLSHSKNPCLFYAHANNDFIGSLHAVAMDQCDSTLLHKPVGVISTQIATVLDPLNSEARKSQSFSSSGKLHVAPSPKL